MRCAGVEVAPGKAICKSYKVNISNTICRGCLPHALGAYSSLPAMLEGSLSVLSSSQLTSSFTFSFVAHRLDQFLGIYSKLEQLFSFCLFDHLDFALPSLLTLPPPLIICSPWMMLFSLLLVLKVTKILELQIDQF